MFFYNSQSKISSRILIPFLFLTCSYTYTFSSDSLRFINDLNLSARVNYGFIYPHHSAIRYLLTDRISGFELCLTTQTYGRTTFDKLYRYPRYGVGYLYTSLGNDEVFGKGHALFFLMNFTILGDQKKVSLNWELDFGPGYLTKVFDPEKDIMNIAISKHLNFFGGFNVKTYYHINDRNEINAGFKFFHFSNGKTGTPNLGLNSFVVSLGYNYRIKPYVHTRIKDENLPSLKRHYYELTVAAGRKADDQINDKRYFTSSFVFDYKFFPWNKYGIGIGTDLFYDESLGPNKTSDLGGNYNNSDLFQAGVHGSVYTRISRLTIMLQVGDYLYATYCKYASFYSRLGFRYNLYKNVSVNVSLKSHYAIADFVEWGLSYCL